jgi:phospholipase C
LKGESDLPIGARRGKMKAVQLAERPSMTQSSDHDNKPAPQPPLFPDLSRREFLQTTVVMAGSALLSSCGSESSPQPSATPPDYFANIKHLVVVMFENRSFDNLLGYLYSQGSTPANWNVGVTIPPRVPSAADGTTQKFEGIWQFSGTAPAKCSGNGGCNTHDGNTALAYPYPAGTDNLPAPDPYEPWEEVRMQVFGIDRALASSDQPTMSGFLRNYADRLDSYTPKLTKPPKASTIMGCYTPEQLPVLSTLARNFAVFDHWYCAVPSQTYCNRAFFHASTSYGFVTNTPWTKWTTTETGNGTIFDVLEKQSNVASPLAPWAVYFTGAVDSEIYTVDGDADSSSVTNYVGLTGLIHYNVGAKYGPADYPNKIAGYPQRFFGFEKFFSDISAGALPQYTFIETLGGSVPFALPEPGTAFDYHPPKPTSDGGNGKRSVLNGEEVLRQIYEAIRTSGAKGGHDYTQDTMLLVVFDEHGGTYDHVPPPKAIQPDNSKLQSSDFKFDWLGVRVPAIAISSYTLPGTIVSNEMHHAAVIKTLFKMNPGAVTYLTERDKPSTVGDLSVACNGARSSTSSGLAPWPELKCAIGAACANVKP